MAKKKRKSAPIRTRRTRVSRVKSSRRKPKKQVKSRKKIIKARGKRHVHKIRKIRKRVSKKTRQKYRKILPRKKSKIKKKKAAPRKTKRRAVGSSRKKIRRKSIKALRYRGARSTQLKFLTEHGVPHTAYILTHKFRIIDGDPVVGIDANLLKKITNDFRKAFKRGLQVARLFINYYLSRGRGKIRREKTVSTPRMPLNDNDSYQELLLAFNSLVLRLYDFASEPMDDPDSRSFKIHVKNVVIELIQIDTGETVS